MKMWTIFSVLYIQPIVMGISRPVPNTWYRQCRQLNFCLPSKFLDTLKLCIIWCLDPQIVHTDFSWAIIEICQDLWYMWRVLQFQLRKCIQTDTMITGLFVYSVQLIILDPDRNVKLESMEYILDTRCSHHKSFFNKKFCFYWESREKHSVQCWLK